MSNFFNEVFPFSVSQSVLAPSTLIPQPMFHSQANDHVFSNYRNEFLTLKSKFSQSSVHHQSFTQCLHSFITNLVVCGFDVVCCTETQTLMRCISHPSHSVFMIACFFRIIHSAFTPSDPNVFSVTFQKMKLCPVHCLCDGLTIKSQVSQWVVHHQPITQCLHSVITNLVVCECCVVCCIII